MPSTADPDHRNSPSVAEARRYRILIENATDGFYEVGLKGRFTYVNPAFCQMTGYRSRALMQMNFRDLADSDSAARIARHFSRLVNAEKKVDHLPCTIIRRDGRQRMLEISIVAMPGKRHVRGFGGIARDVTDLYQDRARLAASEQRVTDLSHAKDKVIHHLSHEIKTPLAVLTASLGLLEKALATTATGWQPVMARARRNLQRLLDMQYEIEDILNDRDYPARRLMVSLLDACADLVETLAHSEAGQKDPAGAISRRIEHLFGPFQASAQRIDLVPFVRRTVEDLRPRFAHRQCHVTVTAAGAPAVMLPEQVLTKVIEGLLRNAIENTPDGSRVDLHVDTDDATARLTVRDDGVGMTTAKQRLVFAHYFTATDTAGYASRSAYDFNAGGRGFDLLRLLIFSERYRFDLDLDSRRCIHIPRDSDRCPGDVAQCRFCRTADDCLASGGTLVTVRFAPAEKAAGRRDRFDVPDSEGTQ